MIQLQYIGLLFACIGGTVLAGLLPDGGANGYQYNRPTGQDFGSGRGFGDRFAGNAIGTNGFGGNGFPTRPGTAYGAPNFGNGGVGVGGGGYNPVNPGFVNRPTGNYAGNGAFAGGPQGGYQQPSGGFGGGLGYQGTGADGYYQGTGGGGYDGDNGRPQPYSFQYEVRDPPSGNDYAQQESSDGNVVRGEYRVLLPDSRTQIVKYTADDVNGYNADVQYEGQAQFPRVGASPVGYNQFGGGSGNGLAAPGGLDAGYQGGFGTANNYQGGRGGYGNVGAFGGGIFPSGGGPGGVGVGGGGGGGGGGGRAGEAGGSNRYLPPSAGGYGK